MSSKNGYFSGRPLLGTIMLGAVLLLIVSDLITAEPIDPYAAPYPVALGSGQAPSGAHCTAVVTPPDD